MAYLATRGTAVPVAIAEALQDAMEHATRNVPAFSVMGKEAKVWVLPDVSSSMQSPVTGFKKGATTAARCVDVAALVAATILRQNRSAEVLCFDDAPKPVALNPRDSVMTNAQRLAAVGGGGTNTSAPLALMNAKKAKADLVIYVSDNQSWVDGRAVGTPTQTMVEWNALVARNPGAKLVCIDLQPYAHTQGKERTDILNVGGFSDRVFEVISAFAMGGLDQGHWVSVIDATNV
jgi:60 kDa SS-A/Ro ribonucleoprotein